MQFYDNIERVKIEVNELNCVTYILDADRELGGSTVVVAKMTNGQTLKLFSLPGMDSGFGEALVDRMLKGFLSGCGLWRATDGLAVNIENLKKFRMFDQEDPDKAIADNKKISGFRLGGCAEFEDGTCEPFTPAFYTDSPANLETLNLRVKLLNRALADKRMENVVVL